VFRVLKPYVQTLMLARLDARMSQSQRTSPVMPNYCLHVLRQGSSEGLIVALSTLPWQDGSSLPTANYDSWNHLQAALLGVGISAGVFQSAEKTLMAEGFCTLTDIPLTCSQLAILGFGEITKSLAA
jgi:hypothetical protein